MLDSLLTLYIEPYRYNARNSKYNTEELRAMMMYDRLGCDKSADEQTIKRAYRKMAMKYHPDKAGDEIALATECFKLINEANTILSDNVKRMK